MTREEAIDLAIDEHDCKYAEEFVDKIYNEHEAQLKLASDVYSTDKMHMYQELKAKDEEIKMLECRAYHAEGYINDLHNNLSVKRFYDKKARSIVAMLFWEWKRRIRLYIENKYRNPSANLALYKQASLIQEVFKEAYKMLKDTK